MSAPISAPFTVFAAVRGPEVLTRALDPRAAQVAADTHNALNGDTSASVVKQSVIVQTTEPIAEPVPYSLQYEEVRAQANRKKFGAKVVKAGQRKADKLAEQLGGVLTLTYDPNREQISGWFNDPQEREFITLDLEAETTLESQLSDELYRVAAIYLELAAKARAHADNCFRASLIRERREEATEVAVGAMLKGGDS